MTCDQAERIADRAIRKARWPIGNILTVVIIAAFLAVTASHLSLGNDRIGLAEIRAQAHPKRCKAAAPMHLKRYQIDGRLLRTGGSR